MMLNPRFWSLVGVVLAAAVMRLVPHPPNFTPIAAMALFGGAHFASKRAGFAVPLAAMLLSDAALEMLHLVGVRTYPGFHTGMFFVYTCFAAIVGLGFLLRCRRWILPVAGAALVASTVFYLVTNFGVWALETYYPKTPAGLLTCYTVALPFFGKTLMGDAFYTAVLFGGFSFAERRWPALRESALAPA